MEIAGRFVDDLTGSYRYPLVVTAPRVAPYRAAPAVLVFASDTAAAGRYTLVAGLAGTDRTAVPGTLTSGATITTYFTFP